MLTKLDAGHGNGLGEPKTGGNYVDKDVEDDSRTNAPPGSETVGTADSSEPGTRKYIVAKDAEDDDWTNVLPALESARPATHPYGPRGHGGIGAVKQMSLIIILLSLVHVSFTNRKAGENVCKMIPEGEELDNRYSMIDQSTNAPLRTRTESGTGRLQKEIENTIQDTIRVFENDLNPNIDAGKKDGSLSRRTQEDKCNKSLEIKTIGEMRNTI